MNLETGHYWLRRAGDTPGDDLLVEVTESPFAALAGLSDSTSNVFYIFGDCREHEFDSDKWQVIARVDMPTA